MEIRKFKSGKYEQQFQYKSFLPEKINHVWVTDDPLTQKLLSEADIKLGELNAYSQLVPSVDLFIRMHIQKEALTSSKIEGTQTTLAEAVQRSENLAPEKRDDWQEVHNYVEAINRAIEELNHLPLSNRLILKLHKILMQGVRGEKKTPGEYRRSQNWIGGASINDAGFIPPHHEHLADLMHDLELFIHNEHIQVPDLVKAGILHYQFETIHPFLDGNGRIGRLLITLYLVSKQKLLKPALYLSDYFEKHKTLYYDNLTIVRSKNDLNQWLKFFFEGVWQTAQSSIDTFKRIIVLKEKYETEKITRLGKKTKTAQLLLNVLYKHPVIDAKDAARYLEVNKTTAHKLIDDFVRLEMLKEISGFKRNQIFVLHEYLDLFKN
ncbi:MAG: Fic family protein [Bacteroidetes bacterium]|nr:Fic family protein [Bacteroidota bacterium]